MSMDRNNTGTVPQINGLQVVSSLYESQPSLSPPKEGGISSVPVPTSSVSSEFQSNFSYVNDTQNTSAPHALHYSVENSRPPGTTVNYAYEPDSTCDVKYTDPPSYEEAIKAMHYRPPQESHHVHHPNQGQFSTSEPYFYQQTSNDLETELAKSFCSRIIFAIIIFGFAACAIRVLYIVT